MAVLHTYLSKRVKVNIWNISYFKKETSWVYYDGKVHQDISFINSIEIHGGPPVPQRLPPEERKCTLHI